MSRASRFAATSRGGTRARRVSRTRSIGTGGTRVPISAPKSTALATTGSPIDRATPSASTATTRPARSSASRRRSSTGGYASFPMNTESGRTGVSPVTTTDFRWTHGSSRTVSRGSDPTTPAPPPRRRRPSRARPRGREDRRGRAHVDARPAARAQGRIDRDDAVRHPEQGGARKRVDAPPALRALRNVDDVHGRLRARPAQSPQLEEPALVAGGHHPHPPPPPPPPEPPREGPRGGA